VSRAESRPGSRVLRRLRIGARRGCGEGPGGGTSAWVAGISGKGVGIDDNGGWWPAAKGRGRQHWGLMLVGIRQTMTPFSVWHWGSKKENGKKTEGEGRRRNENYVVSYFA
jgi:hypothetical protein